MIETTRNTVEVFESRDSVAGVLAGKKRNLKSSTVFKEIVLTVFARLSDKNENRSYVEAAYSIVNSETRLCTVGFPMVPLIWTDI